MISLSGRIPIRPIGGSSKQNIMFQSFQLEARQQEALGVFNIALYVYASSRERAVEIANENGYETRGDDCNDKDVDYECKFLSETMRLKDVKRNTAVHAHDCDQCIYLGTEISEIKDPIKVTSIYDLYYCGSQKGRPTLIARNGEQGDYASGGVFSWEGRNPMLKKAREAAIKKGVITNEQAFMFWHPEWVGEREQSGD